jgi:hypothetical protein
MGSDPRLWPHFIFTFILLIYSNLIIANMANFESHDCRAKWDDESISKYYDYALVGKKNQRAEDVVICEKGIIRCRAAGRGQQGYGFWVHVDKSTHSNGTLYERIASCARRQHQQQKYPCIWNSLGNCFASSHNQEMQKRNQKQELQKKHKETQRKRKRQEDQEMKRKRWPLTHDEEELPLPPPPLPPPTVVTTIPITINSLNALTHDEEELPLPSPPLPPPTVVTTIPITINSLNADMYRLVEGYLATKEFRPFLHVNKHLHGEYIEYRHVSLNRTHLLLYLNDESFRVRVGTLMRDPKRQLSLNASLVIKRVVCNTWKMKPPQSPEEGIQVGSGRRRVVQSGLWGGLDHMPPQRYAINGDGHCLFDTLSFLYLWFYDDVFSIVSDTLIKWGWKPDASSFVIDMKCKGNLMSILKDKKEELFKLANLCHDDAVVANEWWDQYYLANPKLSMNNKNYPRGEVMYLLFSAMFRVNETELCMHNVHADRVEENEETCYRYVEGTYFVPTTDFVGNEVMTALPQYQMTEHQKTFVLEKKNKVHLWQCSSHNENHTHHFEPVLHVPEIEVKMFNSKELWVTTVNDAVEKAKDVTKEVTDNNARRSLRLKKKPSC